ncbi:hypothetical protein ACQPTN_32640 [Bradyrhizobium sp. 13971]|uniref:hypothetical protein n=1 Tax=Bradyrhizobium elkanii TaxID=29448 RepID=UPI00114CFACC|nr:hypothetical protein [Bradyrhizobium elkanii]
MHSTNDQARFLRQAHGRIAFPKTHDLAETRPILPLLLGGTTIVFSCSMMVMFGAPTAVAATACGLSVLGSVAYELRFNCVRRARRASSRAIDLQAHPDPNDRASPALLEAVARFAPRLHRLTRLVHGRFSQVDEAGRWQSDVMLTAYVMGLVDGRNERGGSSDAPRNLLAHLIGASRAEAAIARLCSGVAPWTSGLFEVIEAIGHMDRLRLQGAQLSTHNRGHKQDYH